MSPRGRHLTAHLIAAAVLFGTGGAAPAQTPPEQAPDPIAAGQIARAILAEPGNATYGEYLGADCLTCHQRSGAAPGTPPIAGLPTDYLVQALVEYRMNIRHDDVMRLVTARLTNEQIAALAAYFAAQRPDAQD